MIIYEAFEYISNQYISQNNNNPLIIIKHEIIHSSIPFLTIYKRRFYTIFYLVLMYTKGVIHGKPTKYVLSM